MSVQLQWMMAGDWNVMSNWCVAPVKSGRKPRRKHSKPYGDEAFAFDVPHGVGGLEMSLYHENKQLGCATFLGSYILKLDELSENDDVVQSLTLTWIQTVHWGLSNCS